MYHNGYEKLLTEAAEAKDIPLVEYLLDGLVIMDPGHLSDAQRVFRKVFKDPESGAVAQMFLKKIGVDEATAESYFTKLMTDLSLPRDDVGIYLEYLGGAFASTFLNALSKGDVGIASAVRERYAHSFPLTSETPKSIHGYEVTEYCENMSNLRDVDDARVLFELIVDSGLGDMVGKSDRDTRCLNWLISSNRLEGPMELTGKARSTVALPRLSGGQVSDPELLIALNQAMGETHYPEMYENILVWVEDAGLKDMVGDEIVQIPVHHVLKAGADYKHLEEIPLAGLNLTMLEELNYDFQGMTAKGLDALKIITLGTIVNTADEHLAKNCKILAQYLLTDDHAMGLNHPSGYTLCMVGTQWLAGFELSMPNPVTLEDACRFQSNFYPVDLIYHHAREQKFMSSEPTILGKKDVYFFSAGEIFEMLDTSVENQLKAVIPEKIWRLMYEKTSDRASAAALLLAQKHFGFNLADFSRLVQEEYLIPRGAVLTPNTIVMLERSGYSLWKGSENDCRMDVTVEMKGYKQAEIPRVRLEAYEALMRMGGWPSREPEIDSVKEAVAKGVRVNDSTLQMAFLRACGVEAVVPHIKTKSQWDFFFRIFDNSEISPHLDQLPEHFHADVLATDLGL
jgi:hypothetical protein